MRRLARVLESVRDLLVELVAIRDDDDPRIRPMLLGRHELADGHLLGDTEDVVQRMIPVDELHLLGRLARLGRHLHRIAQHLIDRLVGVVEVVERRALRRGLELHDDARRLTLVQLLLLDKEPPQHTLVDVRVVEVLEIAPVLKPELLPQKSDNPVLYRPLSIDCHFSPLRQHFKLISA